MNDWTRGLGSVVFVLALQSADVYAGRPCDKARLTVDVAERSLRLAANTSRYLDSTEARIAIVARIGRDMKPYGLKYSHFGLAYRDGSQWRVIHKLNHCGTARADVYRQGLGDFFLDGLHQYEAGLLVLQGEAAERLERLVSDDTKAARLHSPHYSLVAYAWGTWYQQSNQWALETLAMALEPSITHREQAQAWLARQGYRPGEIRVGTLERLGARVAAANVSFDDHPLSKRIAGRMQTVTVESVFSWVTARGLGGPEAVVQ